ncbi:MAG TPA: outer membrane lipid asymmetry maintenance protein MlaD, partial [Nitrosomonas sp.]|nr:outer membrane lipid asymmetry maintenance protein MlaD [Nitrosomonas sp.]
GDTIMKTNSAMVLEEMIGRFLFDKASEDNDF